jgi:lactoylglutathione lyase
MKHFYMKYFCAQSGEKYVNPAKKFSSYFISFSDGSRLELMHREDIPDPPPGVQESTGWAHIAISLGSEERVVELNEALRNDGFTVLAEPRFTGDGYFESVILDPENNLIELTV